MIKKLLVFLMLHIGVVHAQDQFTLAFGSCNKSEVENLLWDDVVASGAQVWIWGGDVVYADTDDMRLLRKFYRKQDRVKGYKKVKKAMDVIGTWDDHDYGLNDGGEEFEMRRESQKEFLDFLDVPKDSPRRKREGVYASHNYQVGEHNVKILVLDTRYFRTALTKDTETKKRYKPNTDGKGSVLGTAQWQWLEKELKASKADFNVLVSSVQYLSGLHGFESWGNFPMEVQKLQDVIRNSGAKGVMVLSGDRHISEFSKIEVAGLDYPLVDFTSSGLTHVYEDFSSEENPHRVGEVVNQKSFGTVSFDFTKRTATFKMVGDKGVVLDKIRIVY